MTIAAVIGHASTYPATGLAGIAQPSRKCSGSGALAGVLCREALARARVEPRQRDDIGLYLGACHARMEFVERSFRIADELGLTAFCDPVAFVNSVASAVTGHACRAVEVTGCSFIVNTGVLSGIDAVGLASLAVVGSGPALALAGGVESVPSRAAGNARWLAERPVLGSGGAILLLGAGSAATPACIRGYRTAREDAAECLGAALHDARVRTQDLAFVAGCGELGRDVLQRLGNRAAWFHTRDALGYLGGAEGAIACSVAASSLEDRAGLGKCAAAIGVRASEGSSCLIFGPHLPEAPHG